MNTLVDFTYVNKQNDVMAEYVNRLLAATFRSEYKNVETLSADVELTDGDTPIQVWDPDGGNYNGILPAPDAVENHPYLIRNAGGSGTITVKSNDEATTHAVLNAGEFVFLLPDGEGEYVVFARAFGRVISPSQITANQNNYNPSGAGSADVLRLSSDASREITGLAFGVAGKSVLIVNAGSNDLVLANDDAGSSAVNRFAMGSDLTLEANQTALAWYDGTSQRWRVVGGGGGSGSVGVVLSSDSPRVYTSNNTWAKPTGLLYAVVEVIGGGGAGGGAAATGASDYSAGGGGAGGGYSKKKILAADLAASVSVTVGAGGTGSSGASGGTGGTSSFGSHLQATGGSGGAASSASSTLAFLQGGTGGVGSSGNVNAAGDTGSPGVRNSLPFGGGGGGTHMGGGGAGGVTAAAYNGPAGAAYGGGGAGSANAASQSARAGGAGAAGVVIVWEYVEA